MTRLRTGKQLPKMTKSEERQRAREEAIRQIVSDFIEAYVDHTQEYVLGPVLIRVQRPCSRTRWIVARHGFGDGIPEWSSYTKYRTRREALDDWGPVEDGDKVDAAMPAMTAGEAFRLGDIDLRQYIGTVRAALADRRRSKSARDWNAAALPVLIAEASRRGLPSATAR